MSAQWDDSWLTADDRKAYSHPCRCAKCWPGVTEPEVAWYVTEQASLLAEIRSAEIDAVVAEAVAGAARIEAWLIWAGLWAVAILLPLAIVLGLIHALGIVIGLIIPAAIAGLAGFIYLDQRRN